jgi:aspartyl-tRNA(Asn)/glutamyl-tRNA(Gln) amidotransferase subunit B
MPRSSRATVPLGDFFDAGRRRRRNPKAVGNWVINNLAAKLNESGKPPRRRQVPPAALGELVGLVDSGRSAPRSPRRSSPRCSPPANRPPPSSPEKGLTPAPQVSDTSAIESLLRPGHRRQTPGPAQDFRNGKVAALNFLKGQVMKLSKGKANPAVVGDGLPFASSHPRHATQATLS